MYQINIPHNLEFSPDIFNGDFNTYPQSQFVVSKDKKGEASSFYEDDIWDFSSYSEDGRPFIIMFPFSNKQRNTLQNQIYNESKWLIFLLMWGKSGTPLSKYVIKRYANFLQLLGKYCYENHINIINFFNTIDEIKKFSKILKSGSYLSNLRVILDTIREREEKIHRYNIPSNKNLFFLKELHSIRNQFKQTSPIPTKIYSLLISNIDKEIDMFDKHSSKIFKISLKYLSDSSYGRSSSSVFKSFKTTSIDFISFKDVLKQEKLIDYFEYCDVPLNIYGIYSIFSRLQMLVKLKIHIFTGMRDTEANSLPYDCLEIKNINQTPHYFLNGFTTKFNNGIRKNVSWVTIKECFDSIQIAKKLADFIYSNMKIDIQEKYLFISTGYLPFLPRKKIKDDGTYFNVLNLNNFSHLLTQICPKIEEEDILELENIDSNRDWRNDKDYHIGQYWPLKTHQLRRSLALYAQKTGLVSLTSLKRQLKHITQEMTTYYSRGSSYAKDIKFNKEHFAYEWQETKSISSAFSYISNILMSEEKLIGGHGNWINKKYKDNQGNIKPVILSTREETIKLFKNGEIAFKETALGGCIKVGSCDQIGFNLLDTNCLIRGCQNLVCKPSKLEKIIISQEKFLNSLDKNSVEYRSEKADLEALKEAQQKFIKEKP